MWSNPSAACLVPQGQVTCAITVPCGTSFSSSTTRVITPDVSGYTSASTLSIATSAMSVAGVTLSPDSTNQVTMTPVASSASDITGNSTSCLSPVSYTHLTLP